jgi:hypothetical protein
MMLTELNNSSEKPATKVTLEWREGRDNIESWNEICAWAIEQFGLPGNRYESHPDSDYMLFTFKSKKDADLCRILLSERL